jgi:hypothetical protein
VRNQFISEEQFKEIAARVSRGSVRGHGNATPGVRSHRATDGFKSKLETSYAKHLDLLVKAGEIRRWWYEPTSFTLAKGKRYRPDFLIEYPEGLERRLEYHEIKGRFVPNLRDGLTHLKWCAQLYPCFTWRIVRWTGGGWDGSYVEA